MLNIKIVILISLKMIYNYLITIKLKLNYKLNWKLELYLYVICVF